MSDLRSRSHTHVASIASLLADISEFEAADWINDAQRAVEIGACANLIASHALRICEYDPTAPESCAELVVDAALASAATEGNGFGSAAAWLGASAAWNVVGIFAEQGDLWNDCGISEDFYFIEDATAAAYLTALACRIAARTIEKTGDQK